MKTCEKNHQQYSIGIRRGKTLHYYAIVSESSEVAVKRAKKIFIRDYGDSIFRKMIVRENVTGYPLTKIGC